ncbi:hypothetical protein RJ55_02962 [Drechmeria coniospora]|nr:hypothetical protein RJ55_02962 [Drechmeria coniospora]
MKITQISAVAALFVISASAEYIFGGGPPRSDAPDNVDPVEWCQKNIDVPRRCTSGDAPCEDVCKFCSFGKAPIKQGRCEFRGWGHLWSEVTHGPKCVCYDPWTE